MKQVQKSEATRRRLLQVAREEFSQNGFADTSVDEIVRAAGVTKGAFYHHFRDKTDLFRRVYKSVKQDVVRAAFVVHVAHEPFSDADNNGDRRLIDMAEQTNEEVWAQLIDRCRKYIRLHMDPRVHRIVLTDARWVLDWVELQQIEEEDGIVLLRADLRRASHRGIMRPLPLPMLAALLVGVLNEACLQVANAEDPERSLDEAMAVVSNMLSGLRADLPSTADPASAAR